MSKHIPGEWVIVKRPIDLSRGVYEIQVESPRQVIVRSLGDYTSMDGHVPTSREMEDLTNARLISAAPDLLEACIEMLVATDERVINASKGKCIPEAIQRIKKAIAKAQGEIHE